MPESQLMLGLEITATAGIKATTAAIESGISTKEIVASKTRVSTTKVVPTAEVVTVVEHAALVVHHASFCGTECDSCGNISGQVSGDHRIDYGRLFNNDDARLDVSWSTHHGGLSVVGGCPNDKGYQRDKDQDHYHEDYEHTITITNKPDGGWHENACSVRFLGQMSLKVCVGGSHSRDRLGL